MKHFFKALFLCTTLIFLSCEVENEKETIKPSDEIESSLKGEDLNIEKSPSGSRFMAYGDIITMGCFKPGSFFLLNSSLNGDAVFLAPSSTTDSKKFKIVKPSDPNYTGLVKTGDEIALKSVQSNLYLVAESWDDDVNVNRQVIGPWEKWTIFPFYTTTVGQDIFYSSVSYKATFSLRSVWGKYLRRDSNNLARANGTFNSTVPVLSNPNTIICNKQ